MRRILLTFAFIHILIFDAVAQSDSLSLSALKAEIKREVIAELRSEQEIGQVHKSINDTKLSVYGFYVTTCRTIHASV